MGTVTLALAKLAAIRKLLDEWLSDPLSRYFDPPIISEYYDQFSRQTEILRTASPELFGDLPARPAPQSSGTTDNDGRGYVTRSYLELLRRDIDYIFEVLANSRATESNPALRPSRVFISHGSSDEWREVQSHIERDLDVRTLELAQEPNRGRTVLQKLTEESDRCSYAVVIMTADDEMPDDAPRARQNVIHEIGFFQGKFGLPSVTLLYQMGTDIPSNIHGLVYVPFPSGMVSAAFGVLDRELQAAFQGQAGA
jgi:predicted nucleotide-binding protein